MFANVMNVEEKENFLSLIYKVATCDGDYAEEEQELINNYKIELGISEVKEDLSVEQLIAYFSDKSAQMKKVVFFELYGMVMADNNISAQESRIYNTIKESFELGDSIYDALVSAANKLQEAYDGVYNALLD